jgi:hypothetical protein
MRSITRPARSQHERGTQLSDMNVARILTAGQSNNKKSQAADHFRVASILHIAVM